jgi:hypothetical protein
MKTCNNCDKLRADKALKMVAYFEVCDTCITDNYMAYLKRNNKPIYHYSFTAAVNRMRKDLS